MKLAPKMKKNQSIIVTLSGRGDKDVETIADYIGAKI
jgi:tryptophan synthase beta chain